MKSSIFADAGLAGVQQPPVAELLAGLAQHSAGQGAIAPGIARAAVAMEGHQDANVAAEDIRGAVQSMRAMIERARTKGQGKPALESAQIQAGTLAGILAADPTAVLGTLPSDFTRLSKFSGPLTRVIGNERIADAMDRRIGVESYEERSNKSLQNFSIAYNLEASRQCEFGEAFYPTVVVTPDSVGYNVAIRLILTYSEVQRAASGSVNQFNRQNVIRALVDASILAANQTKLIPVYRKAATANPATDSFDSFVPATIVAPTTLQVDNAPLTTSPLAVGKSFSLLGICQTDASLAQGLNDQTDAIDPAVRLEYVYVQLTGSVSGTATTEVFKFQTKNLPLSDFNAAPQGNTQLLTLNFNTQALEFVAGQLTASGAASQLLATLGTNTARVGVSLVGSIVQDVGTTSINALPVTVAAVNDSTGNALSTTSGAGATVAGVFATASVIGYDLLAFRSNSNRRARGLLIDTQSLNYLYTVPLLPPVTALRPVTASDANDSQLLSNLITVTRAQTANRSVSALLDAQSLLAQYATQPDVVINQPQLFGVASQMVTPAYITQNIDAATVVDSLTSSQRAADLQALLTNLIRDIATRLYVQSGYGPASEAQYEGQPPKTVVIIGTDPILYRYLTLTGDTRLMGDMFDYKIVMSYDSRMVGKIVFSFGHEASFNSGVPDPLHFGNMAWRPELTVMLPMNRNGAQSLELTVQPSYRHVNNLPVLGVINVSNISAVIGGKVALNVQNKVVA